MKMTRILTLPDTHIDFDAQHNDKDCKNKFDDHVGIPKCKRLQSKLV